MLSKIKDQLAQQTNLDKKVWVFFSAFDANGQLLMSNGVIKTDRPLNNILETFYQGLIQKQESQIKNIVFDIVKDLKLQNDPNVLASIPMQQYGIFLVENEGQNSGVLLPNTKGAEKIQDALLLIKKKYNLKSQVSVYIFTTQRISINF